MRCRSILIHLALLGLLPFVVVRGLATFTCRETVASVLDNLMRSSSTAATGIVRSGAVVDRPVDGGQLQRASRLGETREALVLWQAMIAEKPNATNIDYAYGHAAACAASLGETDLTLKYYEIMRRDHDGWRHTGSGGASRRGDERLARARYLISSHPRRVEVLRRMEELDREARARRIDSVSALVRRANAGDPLAKPLLLGNASNLEMMVDLVAEGRLMLAEPAEPREVARK